MPEPSEVAGQGYCPFRDWQANFKVEHFVGADCREMETLANDRRLRLNRQAG